MDIHSLSPQQLQAMSESEKVAVAKQAYTEFLDIMDSVSAQQRAVLQKEIDTIQRNHINQVRDLIARM